MLVTAGLPARLSGKVVLQNRWLCNALLPLVVLDAMGLVVVVLATLEVQALRIVFTSQISCLITTVASALPVLIVRTLCSLAFVLFFLGRI